MKQSLLLLAFSIVCMVNADAAELRTYRVLESEERFFRYGGGLLDFQLSAKVRGTFEVAVDDGRNAHFTAFDLTLHDLVNPGTHQLGWGEGERLEDRLRQHPSELSGEVEQQDGLDIIRLSKSEPWFTDSMLTTNARIQHLTSHIARFTLFSSYLSERSGGLTLPVLDVPSMRVAGLTDLSNGQTQYLLVELVPEASSAFLAACGLLTLVSVARLRVQR